MFGHKTHCSTATVNGVMLSSSPGYECTNSMHWVCINALSFLIFVTRSMIYVLSSSAFEIKASKWKDIWTSKSTLLVWPLYFFIGEMVHVSQFPPEFEYNGAYCCCHDNNYQLSGCMKSIFSLVAEVLCLIQNWWYCSKWTYIYFLLPTKESYSWIGHPFYKIYSFTRANQIVFNQMNIDWVRSYLI